MSTDFLPLLPAQRAVMERLDRQHAADLIIDMLYDEADEIADGSFNGQPCQRMQHHRYAHHHSRRKTKRLEMQAAWRISA